MKIRTTKSLNNRVSVMNALFVFSIVLLGMFVVSFLASGSVMAPVRSDAVNTDIHLSIDPVIELVVSTNNVNVGSLNPVSSALMTSDVTATVSTNNPKGYELSVGMKTPEQCLRKSADSSNACGTIDGHDKIAQLASTMAVESFTVNAWGASLTPYTSYTPVPPSSAAAWTLKTTAVNTANDATTLRIGAKVNMDMSVGAYMGTIVFNAVANALPTPVITSISPDLGPYGQQIDLVGVNFDYLYQVLVGGLECKNLDVTSTTTATCIVPVHMSGVQSLDTMSIYGELSDSVATYTYEFTDYCAQDDLITPPTGVGEVATLRHPQPGDVLSDGDKLYLSFPADPNVVAAGHIGNGQLIAYEMSNSGLSNSISYDGFSSLGDTDWSIKVHSGGSSIYTVAGGLLTYNPATYTIDFISTLSGGADSSLTITEVNCAAPVMIYIWVDPYEVEEPETMQDLDDATCSATSVGDIFVLRDDRDGTDYRVKRFSDGNCWMIDNLKYAFGTQISGSQTSSDAVSQYTDPGAASYCAGLPDFFITKCGYLYNWMAATAGSGTTSVTSGDVSASICPAPFRLPSGGSLGEFENLYAAIGGNGIRSTTIGQEANAPWQGIYTGFYSSGLWYQGNYGYYWSSTASSSTGARNLNFTSSTIFPATANNKNIAYAVRCVLSVGK